MSEQNKSLQGPRWGFIYTLTETHPGSEGTRGAIDLPIAREAASGLPFIPDTSLKGVARAATKGPGEVKDLSKEKQAQLERLFGSGIEKSLERVKTPSGAEGEELMATKPGGVSFLQGSLLLYPLRSLQRMFVYATSPALLDRAQRMARAMGARPLFSNNMLSSIRDRCSGNNPGIVVSDATLAKDGLFMERFSNKVSYLKEAETVARRIADQWPAPTASSTEGSNSDDPFEELRTRIQNNMVVLPDGLFSLLLDTAPPVRARISLNQFGTTESGKGLDGGNLWYEERLPADVLFWTIAKPRNPGVAAGDLEAFAKAVEVCQIGGGATVGHGQCLWHNFENVTTGGLANGRK